MKVDFIKSGAANESDRPEAIKLFCDYIDNVLKRLEDSTAYSCTDDERIKHQQILFFTEPTTIIIKEVIKDSANRNPRYAISFSESTNLKGVLTYQNIVYSYQQDDKSYVERGDGVSKQKEDSGSNKYSNREASLDEIRSVIDFLRENEITEKEAVYNYFENKMAQAIDTNVSDDDVKQAIPKDEQKFDKEGKLNAKINEYIGSILQSMSEKEVEYILGRIKTEKQASAEDMATLSEKLDQIRNRRDYTFTEENLVYLNRLRTQATTEDDRWKPTGEYYWRSEYPVFDKKKSDSPSVMINALYVSRFLFKEFLASLI